jgi:endonuclease YncB( thermonuclease family)
VAEAADQPRSAPSGPSVPAWLLWGTLVFAWLSLAFWGVHTVYQWLPLRVPRRDLPPLGAYDAAEAVTGPTTVRLAEAGEVRLAGVAEPQDPLAGEPLRARLQELLAPGTRVYLEPESYAAGNGNGGRLPVSLFLPPVGAGPDGPFPYGSARLVGAVLVSEGLARADRDRPYRYHAEFLMLEDEARRHRRGLWQAEPQGRPG